MGVLSGSSVRRCIAMSALLGYAIASATVPQSWSPLVLPDTTTENDGGSVLRYNALSTLPYQATDPATINCHFALHFITTTAGKKHEITTNACMVGSSLMLNFLVHNDFSNLRGQSQGNVALEPASARSDYLFMTSAPQNLSTPSRCDKWGPMHWQSTIDTVGLDAVLTPIGGLHWMNGGGGIVLEANSVIPDQFAGFPGYSWYWGNPHMRIKGTVTIDGVTSEIDPTHSFSHYERQWGHFGATHYLLFWLWLETGEMVESWVYNHDENGRSKTAYASVWHANGLIEAVPVGPNTSASDVETSRVTGKKYFNRFLLDLPAINSTFHIRKWFRHAEVSAVRAGNGTRPISESYVEGEGIWKGNKVKFFGHVEQLA